MSDDQEVSFGEVVQNSLPSGETSGVSLDEVFRVTHEQRYPKLTLDSTQAGKVKEFMSQLRLGGSGGIRLICTGDDCDYRKACPLWQSKDGDPQEIPDPNDETGSSTIQYQPTKAPTGEPCPLEAQVVMDNRLQLTSHPDIDMQNVAHRAYVNELCLLAALEWRVNMLLAYDHHSMIQVVPAAIAPNGDVYTKREMNQLLEVLTRVNDRRSKIMTELTISPMTSYKRRLAEGKDDGGGLSRDQSETADQITKAADAPDALPVPSHVAKDPSFHGATRNEGSNSETTDEEEEVPQADSVSA